MLGVFGVVRFCLAILKLMHVIHHIEAAELRHQHPTGRIYFLEEAQRKIIAARKLLASELGVRAFYGSRKAREQCHHQAACQA